MLGLYIVFEGIDYCGKGTIIRKVMEALATLPEFAWLKDKIVVVVEPNNKNRMGMHARAGLGDASIRPKDALLFQEQFMIDRYTTMVCDVAPALEEGMLILGDRSYLSTEAYGSLSVPRDILRKRHHELVGSVMRFPNIAVYLDVTPNESIRRLRATDNKPEHFERLPVLIKVRENYYDLMNDTSVVYVRHQHPETGEILYAVQRYERIIVDAMGEPSVVFERVWSKLVTHLRIWGIAKQMHQQPI